MQGIDEEFALLKIVRAYLCESRLSGIEIEKNQLQKLISARSWQI